MDNMTDGDRICIIYFGTTDLTTAQLVNKVDSFGIKQLLSEARYYITHPDFVLGSYGSYRRAFSATAGVINKNSDDVENYNVLFILSNDDEMIHAGNYSTDMINYMMSAGFIANFVMLRNGNEGMWEYGWKYAEDTGSDYYKYPNYENLPTEFIQKFAYRLAWNTDSDFDSIPDFLEIQGIRASNGRIYYSDPNNSDSDDDTSNDQEEIGVIYELSRDSMRPERISIAFNGATVFTSSSGTIEESSEYYFLYETMNQVEPGEIIIVCVSTSNPELPDSDKDGVPDYKDATPQKANGIISYLIVGKDEHGSDALSRMFQPYEDAFKRKQKDYIRLDMWDNSLFYDKVVQRDVNGSHTPADLFVYFLNNMNTDLSATSLSDSISFNEVDTIVVITHSNYEILDFDFDYPNSGSQFDISMICSQVSIPCHVNILDLQSCYSAKLDYCEKLNRNSSLALEFALLDSIYQVYGWTGEAKYNPFFWANYGYSDDGEYVMICNHVWGYLETKVIGDDHIKPLEYE